MAHPYKDQANSTHKAKAGYLGKAANKDISVMRAVGENSGKKLYASSSNSSQLQDQAKADGMKRGGHVGKIKHKSKPKLPMAAPEVMATPPSPDPSMAVAGAGSSPAPAPMMPPGQPPMKRGGRMTAGGDSGVGRLQKARASGMKPIK
jgi:hypothetical protein